MGLDIPLITQSDLGSENYGIANAQMPRAFYANGMTLIWKEQFNTDGCIARRMSNQKLRGHNLGADLCQVLKGSFRRV